MDPNLGHKAGVSAAGGITFLPEIQLFLGLFIVPFDFLLLFLYFFIRFVGTVLPISLVPTFLNSPHNILHKRTFL